MNTAALSHNSKLLSVKRTERDVNDWAPPVKIEPFDFDDYFNPYWSFGGGSHDFYKRYGSERAYGEDVSL